MSFLPSSPKGICNISSNWSDPCIGNFSSLSKQLELSVQRTLDPCKQPVGLRASMSGNTLMRRCNLEVIPSAECGQQLSSAIDPKCVQFVGKSREQMELIVRHFIGKESQRSDGIVAKTVRMKLNSDSMKLSSELKELEVKRDCPCNRSKSLHLALVPPRLLYRSLSVPSLFLTYTPSLSDSVTTRFERDKDGTKSRNGCNKTNSDGSDRRHDRCPVGNVAPICRQRAHDHSHPSLMSERILP